jgi:ADP-ribose pyrophosphatase
MSRSARTVYEGRVFRVERDMARLPGGRRVPMDIVRHRGSVVLIPRPAPGRVVLIRQFRYVIGRWIWELPAGSLDPGEAPRHAARRECEEEIGLRPARLVRLADYYPTPGFCDERMIFYLCDDLHRPRRAVEKDPDERIVPKTFTLAAAWRLVARRQIIDMKTVLGLLLIDPQGAPAVQRQAGRWVREKTSRVQA